MPIEKIKKAKKPKKATKPKAKKPKTKPKAKPKATNIIPSIPNYTDFPRAGPNYIVSLPAPIPQQLFIGNGTIPEGTDKRDLEKYYNALIDSNKKITKKEFTNMNQEEKDAFIFTFQERLGDEAALNFKKKVGILTSQEKKILKENEEFDKIINELEQDYNLNKRSSENVKSTLNTEEPKRVTIKLSKNPLSKSSFEDIDQSLKRTKNEDEEN